MEDEFVKQTVKSCRLFTEPAETEKYYGSERREFWNSDSDEVMLLVQFFNNCIVSGDPESVEIAKQGFSQLAEKDDEALREVIASVLLRHLSADELVTMFDPDVQPEFRRYDLAVAAKTHPELLSTDRKECIFGILKARVKAFLKDGQHESREAYEEALILGEFGDGRAIPVLRRFASALRESMLREQASGGQTAGKPPVAEASDNDPSMKLWAICSEIEALGGDAKDLRAGNYTY